MNASDLLYGIDLGGTKIEGVVLDPSDSSQLRVLHRLRLPTEQGKGYSHIVQQIRTLVDQLCDATQERPSYIGIGTPGITDPTTGLLKNSNTQCLLQQPLLKDLERTLAMEVRMANDANCFALAEAIHGNAQHIVAPRIIFGIIMGTGVGGGLVVDNRVISGLHGIGGEWGHNTLDPDGIDCYCGKKGCVESVISGPSVERYYKERTGNNVQLQEIHSRHLAGEKIATETIHHLCDRFGEAVSRLINVLDPDAIVLGGGVSNIPELYTLGKERTEHYLFNNDLRTPFLAPKLGDSAGVIGAALLN